MRYSWHAKRPTHRFHWNYRDAQRHKSSLSDDPRQDLPPAGSWPAEKLFSVCHDRITEISSSRILPSSSSAFVAVLCGRQAGSLRLEIPDPFLRRQEYHMPASGSCQRHAKTVRVFDEGSQADESVAVLSPVRQRRAFGQARPSGNSASPACAGWHAGETTLGSRSGLAGTMCFFVVRVDLTNRDDVV